MEVSQAAAKPGARGMLHTSISVFAFFNVLRFCQKTLKKVSAENIKVTNPSIVPTADTVAMGMLEEILLPMPVM